MMFFKKIKCFFCESTVNRKEMFTMFTAKVTTVDGLMRLKMCKKCGENFNELMENIEEVKNGTHE